MRTTFRTTTDPIYKKINIQRGQAGFVRFRRPDGNEIYTVHGQNVFVLLNSRTIHGYAFALPYSPNNPILDPGVQVSRPATTVDAVLKNSSGTIKDDVTGYFQPVRVRVVIGPPSTI